MQSSKIVCFRTGSCTADCTGVQESHFPGCVSPRQVTEDAMQPEEELREEQVTTTLKNNKPKLKQSKKKLPFSKLLLRGSVSKEKTS